MARCKGISERGATLMRSGSVAPSRGPVSNPVRTRGFAVAAALLGTAAWGAGCAHSSAAGDGAGPAGASAVRAVLDAQVAAWNRHDLEGFMQGYWPSEHLVFMTRKGSTRGFRETLDQYRRSYDRPEKFGRLSFDELRFETLDAETTVALGAWRLFDAPGEPHGRFVLVLRRFAEGWRVVSDYTTSDPPPAGPPPSAQELERR
jgi:hypothetical protein